MTPWTCTIPGKPNQKGNSKRAFNGHIVSNPKAVAAEGNVKALAYAQRPAELMEGPLVLDVDFCFAIPPSRRKGRDAVSPGDPYDQTPDRDQLLKLLQDALQDVVYLNDKRVVDGRVRKIWSDTNETRVTVRAWGTT